MALIISVAGIDNFLEQTGILPMSYECDANVEPIL